jgi:hypothetical protein
MSDGVTTYEDWLRGYVHHDGRHGYVTLPCDEVLKIADFIERLRADRKTEPNCSEKPNNSTCSKMEQVDKDTNVRSKAVYDKWGNVFDARADIEDEPQTDEEQFCRDHKCTFYRPQEGGCTKNTGDCPFNDEPQTDYTITGTIGYRCPKCGRGNFLNNESNCVYCGEPLIKTDCAWGKGEEK